VLSCPNGDGGRLRPDDPKLLGQRWATAGLPRSSRVGCAGAGVRSIPREPRGRTRRNPAGLTARDLKLLALLASGLRNVQIAERLIVCEQTVDHHVSAILTSLRFPAAAKPALRRRGSGLTIPR
jgi:DNA-binding CsgD family transcriptional regulator